MTPLKGSPMASLLNSRPLQPPHLAAARRSSGGAYKCHHTLSATGAHYAAPPLDRSDPPGTVCNKGGGFSV